MGVCACVRATSFHIDCVEQCLLGSKLSLLHLVRVQQTLAISTWLNTPRNMSDTLMGLVTVAQVCTYTLRSMFEVMFV